MRQKWPQKAKKGLKLTKNLFKQQINSLNVAEEEMVAHGYNK
jgi:hypothetical protein